MKIPRRLQAVCGWYCSRSGVWLDLARKICMPALIKNYSCDDCQHKKYGCVDIHNRIVEKLEGK